MAAATAPPREGYSSQDTPLHLIKPVYTASSTPQEPDHIQTIIDALALTPHIEGGYYIVTDINYRSIPSPYPAEPLSPETVSLSGGLRPGYDPKLRLLSTSILYYLTPRRPMGSFHMNRTRIIHTLIKGRGRYVLIHPEEGRVESFVVGHNVSRGEKVTWVVEGGLYKASYLLRADGDEGSSNADQDDNSGLLISETVVPGFEYTDHEFLSLQKCKQMLSQADAKELEWLVKHSRN